MTIKKPVLSTTTEIFLKQLNKFPKLFNETPTNTFVPTVYWPMFHTVVKKPFIIYVSRPGLTGVDFHIERSEPLALGYLHFLQTSSLAVGYAFEINFADVLEYNTHYFMAHKKDVVFTKKIKPEVPLTNQHISVYSYAEEFVLAVRKQFVFPAVKP